MAKSEKNLVAVFTDTANAIRGKLESQEQISPLDFADQINSITGYPEPEGTEYISANGQYNIKDYEFVEVNLNVPESDGAYIIYNGNWVYPGEMPVGKYYKFTGSKFDPMEYSEGGFYWIYNDNLYYNNVLNSGGAICYIEDINNGVVVDTGAETYGYYYFDPESNPMAISLDFMSNIEALELNETTQFQWGGKAFSITRVSPGSVD